MEEKPINQLLSMKLFLYKQKNPNAYKLHIYKNVLLKKIHNMGIQIGKDSLGSVLFADDQV